jgi:hypothetical protein
MVAWRDKRSLALAAFTSLVLLAAGCGSDDDSDATGTSAATTNAGSAGDPAPDELVGTYEVTLKPSDLPPDPPAELTDGSAGWRLEIANHGGTGGGRSFAISNKSLGSLEDPRFLIDGDSIVLKDEECASESGGYDYYDNEYRYELQGDSLSFTTVTNSCPDQVAETILTSRPWTRVR